MASLMVLAHQVFTVIQVHFHQNKTRSFALSDIIAQPVHFIQLFVRLELPHSKEAVKILQIASPAKKDSTAWRVAFLSSYVPKGITVQ
jgi:hypothetical protein